MILFSPNISMLWTDVPLAERFQRAADAGFGAVELWWPGEELAQRVPELARAAGVELALMNFDAGDMAAGDRGLASDPDRFDQLRTNVPVALAIASAAGCQRLTLLVGKALDEHDPARQLEWARENVAWAADQAAAHGASVMIEALNTIENGPYLLSTTAAAAAFVASVGRPNVRLQYDAYHMQRMEGDLTTTIERHRPLIGHIQIADAPGRNQPGTGEINFGHLLSAIDGLGYTGYVGLEYRPLGETDDSFAWIEELDLPRKVSGP